MSFIRDKFVERIKGNKKLYYLCKCIKNINNKSFVEDMINLHKSPLLVRFDSYGKKNKEKVIYLINSGDTISGFFAEYRRWLESIYFADRFGLEPVINISKKSFYAEQETIYGTDNPFEYYFVQPSNNTVLDALNSYNVVEFRDIHRKLSNDSVNYWGYNVTESYISEMAIINQKYIHLNDRVKNDLKKQIFDKTQNKKTIGVHIRGTDFKVGYDNHPVMITPEQFLKCTEDIFNNADFEQVFLATDELTVIEMFYNKFRDKLVYYSDVERADGSQSVVFSNNKRENHRYLLGYEVLRDMHTLASCDALIAGLSSVSTCARIEKRSNYEKDYDYVNILSNGISYSTRDAEKDIKKLKDEIDKSTFTTK